MVSSDVFVNGIGVSRQGDNNTTHLLPGSCLLMLRLQGSSTVFVNGKGCGRVGDVLHCLHLSCSGSSNVSLDNGINIQERDY